tara:strand:- start:40 stop:312 length:273 start_codon:yes stop_codon:yes gene_type:complete
MNNQILSYTLTRDQLSCDELLEAILVFNFKKQLFFKLSDVYKVAEGCISYHYPRNNRIKSCIRRNLQKLRDDGIIKFIGKGTYAWVRVYE